MALPSLRYQALKGLFFLSAAFSLLALGAGVGLLAAVPLFHFIPSRFAMALRWLIDLLAGIPSVIYGLFGMVVIVPFLRDCVSSTGMGYGILVASPRIPLLDEPTSALAPISTARIEDLLASLKSTLTIAIVTHNLQQAARIADATAFFLLGEIAESGTTEDLFRRLKGKRTENCITGRFG